MNIKWKGMPQLYTATEDVLEWNWLLYCASVKEGMLWRGGAGAAAEYTQRCSVELIRSRGIRNPPKLLCPGPKQGGQQEYQSSCSHFRASGTGETPAIKIRAWISLRNYLY